MSEAAINVVRLADVAAQPWKNGGGVTRELLTWPNANDWAIRVSVADIECDGPFSSFPGVDRYFAVLHGSGVRLAGLGEFRVGDNAMCFDGALAPACVLIDGPTRDLNVMVRRDKGHGSLLLSGKSGDTVRAADAILHGVYAESSQTLAWTVSEKPIGLRDVMDQCCAGARCWQFFLSSNV
jgi:environmental stress-induced protein Ves